MSAIRPIISIKAGKCNVDGNTVMPLQEPGLLYLYFNPEEELHHLCWKPRHVAEPAPEDDLLVIPGDASFVRYENHPNGRIFVLKFSSSSQRNFYWLQTKSEGPEGVLNHWSARDKEWGRTINRILRGDDYVESDAEMGDNPPTGAADLEEEGEESRRGGEDGGRAANPATNTGNIDIASLISGITVPGGAQGTAAGRPANPNLSLHDLLTPAHTLAALGNASPETVDNLVSNLPPTLVPENASLEQKKSVIARVLQSPQFQQGCASLTVALREGALRGVADSLRVPLAPGEEMSGDPVEVFVNGVKRQVEKKD